MGLRHLIIVDGDLFIKGIITRFDMNEHRLHHTCKKLITFASSNLIFIIL